MVGAKLSVVSTRFAEPILKGVCARLCFSSNNASRLEFTENARDAAVVFERGDLSAKFPALLIFLFAHF